jgi:hypothetical protein
VSSLDNWHSFPVGLRAWAVHGMFVPSLASCTTSLHLLPLDRDEFTCSRRFLLGGVIQPPIGPIENTVFTEAPTHQSLAA